MVCRCATKEIHEQRYMDSMNYTQKQREEYNQKKIDKLKAELSALTPDSTKWEFEEFIESFGYIIAKVKFEACEHAGYGGMKVLVFKATTLEAVKWRIMDPHFREKPEGTAKNEAPVPVARFPASAAGWEDARLFVKAKHERESKVGIRGTKSVHGVFDPEREC